VEGRFDAQDVADREDREVLHRSAKFKIGHSISYLC
jgi:hypothetical protein